MIVGQSQGPIGRYCTKIESAKRPFSPIFVDFDKKAQKSNQNKAGIGIAHQFYIEKGISGVIPEIFFIYWTPLIGEIPWFSEIFGFERHFWSV